MEEALIRKLDVIGEDGTKHMLYFYREWIPSRTLDGTKSSTPGLKRITTEDGTPVNYLEKGKYKNVETGEVLRSSAPDAP